MSEVRQHSVTRDDVTNQVLGAGGPSRDGFLWFLLPALTAGTPIAVNLPPYWSPKMDYTLRGTLRMEAMWSASVYRAATKFASQSLQIKDSRDIKVRAERAQRIMLGADDGQGWVPFITKVVLDHLLTCNGWFIEIVRATSAAGSRVLGLMHLDSARCTRTGDPERPVLYRDLKGSEHVLKRHQVIYGSDLPDAAESWFGVGHCAAERAWQKIKKLAGIELYLTEKVTGSKILSLHFITGVDEPQLKKALKAIEADRRAEGFMAYMGAGLIPGLDSDEPISIASIQLAGLPDNFNPLEERRDAYQTYANALGIPVQDIQPLQGQLGTGTQSIVLDEAADAQGLAALRQNLTHWFNETQAVNILSTSTTFAFVGRDWRDQRLQAETRKIRAEHWNTLILAGIIDAQQALQMAVDVGDVPDEFIPKDETEGGTLYDDEKAGAIAGPVDNTDQDQPAPPTQPNPPAQGVPARSRPTRFGPSPDNLLRVKGKAGTSDGTDAARAAVIEWIKANPDRAADFLRQVSQKNVRIVPRGSNEPDLPIPEETALAQEAEAGVERDIAVWDEWDAVVGEFRLAGLLDAEVV